MDPSDGSVRRDRHGGLALAAAMAVVLVLFADLLAGRADARTGAVASTRVFRVAMVQAQSQDAPRTFTHTLDQLRMAAPEIESFFGDLPRARQPGDRRPEAPQAGNSFQAGGAYPNRDQFTRTALRAVGTPPGSDPSQVDGVAVIGPIDASCHSVYAGGGDVPDKGRFHIVRLLDCPGGRSVRRGRVGRLGPRDRPHDPGRPR